MTGEVMEQVKNCENCIDNESMKADNLTMLCETCFKFSHWTGELEQFPDVDDFIEPEEYLKDLENNQIDLEPEIIDAVNKDFWELYK